MNICLLIDFSISGGCIAADDLFGNDSLAGSLNKVCSIPLSNA